MWQKQIFITNLIYHNMSENNKNTVLGGGLTFLQALFLVFLVLKLTGKTVVAMIAAYKAVKSGYQAAIMAPTAILASQHLEGFKEILEQLGIRSELLISSVTKKRKKEIKIKKKSKKLVKT